MYACMHGMLVCHVFDAIKSCVCTRMHACARTYDALTVNSRLQRVRPIGTVKIRTAKNRENFGDPLSVINTYIYIYIHTQLCTCIYIYIYIHMYVSIYICILYYIIYHIIYIYIYIYIHLQTHNSILELIESAEAERRRSRLLLCRSGVIEQTCLVARSLSLYICIHTHSTFSIYTSLSLSISLSLYIYIYILL